MLPKYYNHVKEHENTLITKFFGLHRITLPRRRKVSVNPSDLAYIQQCAWLMISVLLLGALCGYGEYVLHRTANSSSL